MRAELRQCPGCGWTVWLKGWPSGFDKKEYPQSHACSSQTQPVAAELRLSNDHRNVLDSGGVELFCRCSTTLWSSAVSIFDGMKLDSGHIRPQAPGIMGRREICGDSSSGVSRRANLPWAERSAGLRGRCGSRRAQ